MINVPPQDVAFDIECYPNVFTAYFIHVASGREWCYEISDRRNMSSELHEFLRMCQAEGCRLVGFNNVGYDYPVLHNFLDVFAAQGTVMPHQLYSISNSFITSDAKFGNAIPHWLVLIPQIDLRLIHHLDNKNKMTPLKMIEINMRSESVQDLPYTPGSVLTSDEIDNLIKYNRHDVLETAKFYKHTLPMIQFREKLSEKHKENWLNYNDTKIGKEFFTMELEKAKKGLCFDYVGRKKIKRQTPRSSIEIGPVILPYIRFDRPEFNAVLERFRAATIKVTKDPPEFKDLCAVINGFQFDFGAGGIHGSVSSRIIRSDETHVVMDADVVSYYPSIPIGNRFYPEHLTEIFCDVYADLLEQRKSFPKGTPENAMLKLALNGVYGDSGNQYGVFLDPRYMMQVTINGQLSLAMLSEKLIDLCEADMVQANTDGITVRIPRDKLDKYFEICDWWQKLTKLELEFVEYDGMWIRDVNSYVSKAFAEWKLKDGAMVRKPLSKIKRVGAYQYHTPDMHMKLNDDGTVEEVKGFPAERGWHQDLGGLIVPKAAEAVMLRGESLETFIRSHRDPFDFMLRVKVPRSSRLMHGDSQVQNISRYYVAKRGARLTKVMPPTPRKPDKERNISIEAGHDVALCNVASDFDWSNLNYDYYIAEARKLLLTPGDLFARLH